MPVDRAWEAQIHLRLLDGDPVASEELCHRLLGPLERFVRKQVGPLPDEEDVADAVVDAVMDYITAPAKYDPSKGKGLFGYLCMAALRNMINTLRSVQRRARHTVPLTAVEDPPRVGNREVQDERASGEFEAIETAESVSALWDLVLKTLADPTDLKVARLIVAGERRTAVFAAALGITGLPPDEQRIRVKRAKDRTIKRLRRAGKGARDA